MQGHGESFRGRAHRTLPVQHDASVPAARSEGRLPSVEAVYCPECGMPAWVEWGDLTGSDQGASELVKVRCFSRHWFLIPGDRLPR